MSVDNCICILEMEKDGQTTYLVADNIPMSYNVLSHRINLSIHWQGPMVYNIWKGALKFNSREREAAFMTAHRWEEDNYYEYGTCVYSLSGDWDDVIKANEENECYHCHGAREVNIHGRTANEICPTCKGSGLRKPYEESCYGCDGKGMIGSDHDPDTEGVKSAVCPACKGSGLAKDYKF